MTCQWHTVRYKIWDHYTFTIFICVPAVVSQMKEYTYLFSVCLFLCIHNYRVLHWYFFVIHSILMFLDLKIVIVIVSVLPKRFFHCILLLAFLFSLRSTSIDRSLPPSRQVRLRRIRLRDSTLVRTGLVSSRSLETLTFFALVLLLCSVIQCLYHSILYILHSGISVTVQCVDPLHLNPKFVFWLTYDDWWYDMTRNFCSGTKCILNTSRYDRGWHGWGGGWIMRLISYQLILRLNWLNNWLVVPIEI